MDATKLEVYLMSCAIMLSLDDVPEDEGEWQDMPQEAVSKFTEKLAEYANFEEVVDGLFDEVSNATENCVKLIDFDPEHLAELLAK